MAEPLDHGPGFCSRCGRPVVVADASFCKECGAPLGSGLRFRRQLNFNPWVAAALSVIPGLGHLYKGHPWKAGGWFILVGLFYGAQPLGFILHLVCAANAAFGGAIEDGLPVRALRRRRTRSGEGLA